ncbi:DUF2281 domain-containing protein [candidate division WOR-3 bacterium]|nr:DUF2281 domain-containing protein [candidate division WOR-3 bacterium]
MESTESKLRKLPPELQNEVADFVDFLYEKSKKKNTKKLSLNWAGGLKEYKNKFTSLELQKKIIEWWGD